MMLPPPTTGSMFCQLKVPADSSAGADWQVHLVFDGVRFDLSSRMYTCVARTRKVTSLHSPPITGI